MISEERIKEISNHYHETAEELSDLEISELLEAIQDLQEKADKYDHLTLLIGTSTYVMTIEKLQAENGRYKELMPRIGTTCKFWKAYINWENSCGTEGCTGH